VRISDFDPEGDSLRKSVLQMLESKIFPIIESAAPGPLDRASMHEIYAEIGPATGYFGTRVPLDDGGSGLPKTLAGVFLECLPAFLGVSFVSHEATTYRILLSASEELKKKYVRSLAEGVIIGGTAVSEPDTGSDSNHPKTRFIVSEDNVKVVGTKLWTTNASVADVVVVIGVDERTGKVARLLVDTKQTEVIAREVPMIGLKRGHLCELAVVGPVPIENLLGSETAGSVLARSWTMNRISMALLALSIANNAVCYSVEFAKNRSQFGRPIGEMQLVQALLADAATSVEAGRLLCYRALSSLDDGVESTLQSSMAKLFGTEAAIQAVIKAQQVVGTFGVSSESPFDEWYRDVRMFAFPDGTSQIQQLLIGRELTGLSAF
jgi:alkylation response protein AidB-like acyl-CoA dehydrogenase